jgi:hypothetical protein
LRLRLRLSRGSRNWLRLRAWRGGFAASGILLLGQIGDYKPDLIQLHQLLMFVSL